MHCCGKLDGLPEIGGFSADPGAAHRAGFMESEH